MQNDTPSYNILTKKREEGDLNSRDRKINGLAIHRRAGLGHPRFWKREIKHNDKKVMLLKNQEELNSGYRIIENEY